MSNYPVIFVSDFFAGYGYSFIEAYSTSWAAQFGLDSNRTLIFSLLYISNPIGKLFGILLSYFLDIDKVNLYYFNNFIFIVDNMSRDIYCGYILICNIFFFYRRFLLY